MSLLPWMMAGGIKEVLKTDWLSVLAEVEMEGKRLFFESIDELILRSAKMHSLSGAVCCWSEMIGVWVVWLLLQLEIWLLVELLVKTVDEGVRLDLVSAADGEAERAFGEIIVPPLDHSCQSMQWLLNFKFYNFHHRPDHHHCWTGQQRADKEAGNSGNSKSFSSHLHCPAHCATRQ